MSIINHSKVRHAGSMVSPYAADLHLDGDNNIKHDQFLGQPHTLPNFSFLSSKI